MRLHVNKFESQVLPQRHGGHGEKQERNLFLATDETPMGHRFLRRFSVLDISTVSSPNEKSFDE